MIQHLLYENPISYLSYSSLRVEIRVHKICTRVVKQIVFRIITSHFVLPLDKKNMVLHINVINCASIVTIERPIMQCVTKLPLILY